MRPKPKTSSKFLRRYPRTTAHIVSENLGCATPTAAARIRLAGLHGRENWYEWVYCCYGGGAREVLCRSIQRRHGHKGRVSWYKVQGKGIASSQTCNRGGEGTASWKLLLR